MQLLQVVTKVEDLFHKLVSNLFYVFRGGPLPIVYKLSRKVRKD